MDQGHALVQALLYGQMQGLSGETIFLFTRTGLIHLFSASGFHLFAAVKVADGLCWFLLPFVKKPRDRDLLRFAARFLLMIFFGNATDWSSPMVRAFVFASLGAGSRLLEMSANLHWIFLLSLVVSAVLGKGGTLSFLLSAAGMAGILYVQPRKAWAIALGPWLFTMPITLYCFGIFPLFAPLWNLSFGLAISWLVLPLAILSLVGKSVGIPVHWLDVSAAWLMQHLTEALQFAADAAGGTFWVRPLPWVALAGGLLLAQFLWRTKKKRAVAVAAAALLVCRLWPSPALSLLDVGQGDAILLQTPTGVTILNDVGPPDWKGGMAPVSRKLEELGVGDIDHVMLSHFDLDHRGGLESLLVRHNVSALWFREENLWDKRAEAVLAAAERSSVPIHFLTRKKAPPGLECWLAPFSAGNDSSPLCRGDLGFAGKVLLTGDMGEKAEAWYLHSLRPFPRAETLKVAHHGSRTSSTADFLRASGARVALISVGARNRYHHPTPETLKRLDTQGMRVERTDLSGTVNVYFSAGFFTDEIARFVAAKPKSREYPGSPALARREYASPARVK